MNLPQQRQRIAVDGLGGIGVGKYTKTVAKSEKSGIINKKKNFQNNISTITSIEKMPNAITASTSQNKIQGYLLNNNHPVGKNKARVLNSILGYHYQNWNMLSDKIYSEIQTTGFTDVSKTKYGTKYVIPVWIEGEKGKSMLLNTVWQIDNNSNIPRMITVTFNKKNVR